MFLKNEVGQEYEAFLHVNSIVNFKIHQLPLQSDFPTLVACEIENTENMDLYNSYKCRCNIELAA